MSRSASKQSDKLNCESDPSSPSGFALQVLDQYLLQELIQPLLYGLLAFSSLAVSIGKTYALLLSAILLIGAMLKYCLL